MRYRTFIVVLGRVLLIKHTASPFISAILSEKSQALNLLIKRTRLPLHLLHTFSTVHSLLLEFSFSFSFSILAATPSEARICSSLSSFLTELWLKEAPSSILVCVLPSLISWLIWGFADLFRLRPYQDLRTWQTAWCHHFLIQESFPCWEMSILILSPLLDSLIHPSARQLLLMTTAIHLLGEVLQTWVISMDFHHQVPRWDPTDRIVQSMMQCSIPWYPWAMW